MSNKNLKIPHHYDSQIWFTGCTHIFHKQPFIWEKRGYRSIEDHAYAVKVAINSCVRQGDTLIHLGDGFLNSTPEEVSQWLGGIYCENIYYIWGNHESSMSKLYRESANLVVQTGEVYPCRYRNVTFLGAQVEVSLDECQHAVLSHFPLAIWNRSHHGSWNIHSHCHGTFAGSLPQSKKGKRLDVGWDVFRRPVNYSEIRTIMSQKSPEILDHHDSSTT